MKKSSNYFAAIIPLMFIAQFSTINSQAIDSCNSTLSLKGQLPFDTASFNCHPVWNSHRFILRYFQTDKNQWSFVLSAPNANSYIGIGFSPDGMMVGSSAIVGWVGADGVATMKKYYLGGQLPSKVNPDSGNLQVGNSSIVVTPSAIYMAFQLNTDKPEAKVIYSIGPPNVFPSAPNFRLTRHADQISTSINYATGQTQKKSTTYATLRRSHGLLSMFGWGIFMPIGVLVARHLRQYDPIWFYSHVGVQSSGFLIGAAGVICGFVLNSRVSRNVSNHKTIGIIVSFLGCLQVIAILARPDKASKSRKFWNWYHYGVGRILIFLAAVNVFYGVHLANGGNGWKAGYAIFIVLIFIISVVLESRQWMRK